MPPSQQREPWQPREQQQLRCPQPMRQQQQRLIWHSHLPAVKPSGAPSHVEQRLSAAVWRPQQGLVHQDEVVEEAAAEECGVLLVLGASRGRHREDSRKRAAAWEGGGHGGMRTVRSRDERMLERRFNHWDDGGGTWVGGLMGGPMTRGTSGAIKE